MDRAVVCGKKLNASGKMAKGRGGKRDKCRPEKKGALQGPAGTREARASLSHGRTGPFKIARQPKRRAPKRKKIKERVKVVLSAGRKCGARLLATGPTTTKEQVNQTAPLRPTRGKKRRGRETLKGSSRAPRRHREGEGPEGKELRRLRGCRMASNGRGRG